MTSSALARTSPDSDGAEARDGAADEHEVLALLTGPARVGVIAGALAGDAPTPAGLTVDVAAVHHRPGAGVSVCYQVTYGAAAQPEVLVASTTPPSRHDRQDRVATLDDGVHRVRVWRRPDDPALPGLREALNPSAVASWLGGVDVPALTVLSYRPTRRAVVLARGIGASAYLKVVRPRRAADLVQRHALLVGSAVPAPAVLAEPVPGVVVLAEAPGSSLAQALASGDPARVPEPERVLAALDTLPLRALDLDRRPSWVDRLDFHAAAARGAVPGRSADVDAVVERVTAALAAAPDAATVVTHGDLNVANLFVDDASPSALIDVDSLGPGRREDDLATLLAHLTVLPALAPEQYGGVPEVLARWREAFARTVHPGSLHARTAAVLVSLVAGAAPEQAHARLDLAINAVGRAEHGGTA